MPDARVDVACLGEALVDLVSTKSGVRLDRAPAFRKAAGGAPANVAVGVARLGRRSGFIGALANDPLGRFLGETLRRAGVDVRATRRSRHRTALALVSLALDGDREFLFYGDRAAHFDLTLTAQMRRMIRNARIFHFGSISLIQDPARTATMEAIREARAAGALCSYDPNLRLNLWPDAGCARRWMWDALGFADVVKVNEEEMTFLTGRTGVAGGLRALTAAGPRLAIMTQGARGCAFRSPGGEGQVPGYPAHVLDTTGAGDAFMAGLLAGLLDPLTVRPIALPLVPRLEWVLAYANAAAALSTERRGGIPSLPSRRRVDAFLRALPVR
ncbi:MAG: PfkB family carbohydrate kinase [candidate division NC10 bacterium]|nr:PfkB family carbohydrate kinase [candidate division NC10 bacterium]